MNNNGNVIDKIKKMGFTDNSSNPSPSPAPAAPKSPSPATPSSISKPNVGGSFNSVNKVKNTKSDITNANNNKSGLKKGKTKKVWGPSDIQNVDGTYDDINYNEYDDENPNWSAENDEHYKFFDDSIKKANYSQEDIDSIIDMAEKYSRNAERGVITYEQMDDIANKMGLKNLSDRDLRLAWDKYYDILRRESFKGGSMKRWEKFGDAASAFAEVINREARNRKERGNYFPYDENDINEAKNKIASIAKPHEGYDLDYNEAYLTNEEGEKIKRIADQYHLTDEDLAKISNIFGGKMGYSGYGWKGK